ncbi:MAG: phosphoribosylamine--glycine ligase [Pirellulaceae bacterium]|nr:phosphoribosylamine--glycine ligase [Pirellulaceae bacterium]
MNVLVIGGGGREHALAWKIKQSPRVDRVFVAPGNAGTAIDAENVDIDPLDFPKLVEFAQANQVGLTVVGPEVPLCAGIVDHFQQAGLRIFGPSRAAAQLEGSKVFCKQMLRTADVPTADFWVFYKAAAAFEFVEERFGKTPFDVPLVVKTDGLAAGKGAIVCFTMDEVKQAIRRVAIEREFGDAGNKFILEMRLSGPEVSVLAITDGNTILTLPPAQDHKRAYDGDRGPNTGGMGAYCPAPVIDEETLAWVEEHVFVQTIHAMKRGRMPFRGILYAGLMLTPQGPKVLEYNVRFGDPECQPLLMRLQSDLVEIMELVIDGRLAEIENVTWDPRPAVCVVMAAEGYPNDYRKGQVIRGLESAAELADSKVFHAGTKLVDGQVVTSGGRVLGVTALGSSVANAKLNAYTAVKEIRWDGAWCRKDISDGALLTTSGKS